MADYTIFGTGAPAGVAAYGGGPFSMSTEFSASGAAWLKALRFYRASTAITGTITGRLYRVTTGTTGTAVSGTDVTFTLSGTGWQTATFSTPVALVAGARYRAVVRYPGNYPAVNGYWTNSVTSGPLTAYSKAAATGTIQSGYVAGALAYPTAANGANYWIDVVVTDADPFTKPGLETLVDTFSTGTIDKAGRWSGTYDPAGNTPSAVVGGRARVYADPGPKYANIESAEAYTISGSFLLAEVPKVVGVTAGSTGTCQTSMFFYTGSQPGGTRATITVQANLGTISFTLDSGYWDPTKVEIAYDPVAHRWWRIAHVAPNLVYSTSPDGWTWTVRRTVAAPAWVTSSTAMRADFEAWRDNGAQDYAEFDNINAAPTSAPAPTEPAWAPLLTGGTVTWAADYAQANAVAAGYADAPWNRDTAAGLDAASGLAWPPPTDVAPFGRPGRAVRIRLPDGGKRYEIEPTGSTVGDGAEMWAGFDLLFEGDLDLDPNVYQTVWQLRPDDSRGSPPVSLELADGGLRLVGGWDRPDEVTGVGAAGTYAYGSTIAALTSGEWHRIVVYVGVWSKVNTGRVDVWLNGAKVVDAYVPPCGTNYSGEAGTSYPKNGVYHDASNRGATVWFAEHRHGTSLAAVTPTAVIAAAYGDVIAEP